MKTVLISLALFAGQAMTLQPKPIVHLKPHTDRIEAAFGGSLLELSQAPAVVQLPLDPPKPDSAGNQWIVDVRNYGPSPVTILGKGDFSTQVAVNQTIHVASNGSTYLLQH